jgi:hypothetical protein
LLPLGGLGLLLGGGVVGGVDITGGGVPDVVGGFDCAGQFALASITDPSGHVLVVGVAMINLLSLYFMIISSIEYGF